MELTFVVLMWLSSLILTLASFITNWRKYLIFPLMAGIFWNATALLMVQVHYVGYGSQNIIVYSHELGDWSGEIGVMYLCHGFGVLMLCVAVYYGLLISRGDLELIEKGKAMDWERIN